MGMERTTVWTTSPI